MMRQYHRWFSFPLILFLFIVTVTGVVLQGEEVAGGLQPRPAPPKVSALPSDAAFVAQVQQALAAAKAAQPDFAAQQVTFDYSRGQAKVRFGVQPRGGPSIDIDLKTGATKVQAAPKPSLHVTMIQLHTGRMFGPVGLIVMMLVSLVFMVLTVTGLLVYIDMWKRRRAASKKGFFWR